jgi:hypothetical protein
MSALQRGVDNLVSEHYGFNAVYCLKVLNTIYPEQSVYAENCSKEVPSGYTFAVPQSYSKENVIQGLKSLGAITIGKSFSCTVSEPSILLGREVTKNYSAIPVRVNNGYRYRNGNLGAYVCGGKILVSKIVSSTKPHYNQNYSMKTVVVKAVISYSGIDKNLTKYFPDTRKEIVGKTNESISEAEKDEGSVTAILGEESQNNWKVVKFISLDRN